MIVRVNGETAILYCPACQDLHKISTGPNKWTLHLDSNGMPTISPSIKVGGVQWPEDNPFHKPVHHNIEPGQPVVCHSFVRDGQWQFLGDCTHDLAGQTVPCEPIPDGLFTE